MAKLDLNRRHPGWPYRGRFVSMMGKQIDRTPNAIRRFIRILGPGLITGASDDDPSGIATYASVGASLGYTTLWAAVATFPMMTVVQYICAKIGMVAGTGLAAVVRQHYPKYVLYPLVTALVVANTINAGTDIGAIGAAIGLLVPVRPTVLMVPVTVVILALQIWGSYRLIVSTFKWFTLALFAYVGAAAFARPDLRAVLQGTFVPTFSLEPHYLASLVALLGTTISPYLFFWQANNEVEEEISKGRCTVEARRGATKAELRDAALDVTTGMLLSNVVMYFIILTTAATLFKAGRTDIQSAADAAKALEPLAGAGATVLLAVGLVGAGMLGVPVLTGSSAYAIAEVLDWNRGLDEKPHRAKLFYAAIVVPTLLGALIDIVGFNPIAALFWTAVLNGFVAPPILVVVMCISGSRTIMGDAVNGRFLNITGWVTTGIMFAAAAGLVWAYHG